MPIRKMIECDVCHKLGDFWRDREDWFIVNISHVYCSEKCFEEDTDAK